MKKSFLPLLIVCLFSLLVIEGKANSIFTQVANLEKQVSFDNPPDYNLIDLLGRLDYNASSEDITAWVENNTVHICFSRSFGNVSISLYNPNGLLIHNSVVDTSVQQQVIIPIYGFTNGIYTLVLENATGYVEGDFEEE